MKFALGSRWLDHGWGRSATFEVIALDPCGGWVCVGFAGEPDRPREWFNVTHFLERFAAEADRCGRLTWRDRTPCILGSGHRSRCTSRMVEP